MPTAVHIHIVSLDCSHEPVAATRLLSSDERERAAGFVFETDRRRFTLARASLRRILGRYLDAPPESLVFAKGTRGKPALPGTGLEFNVSHSHELAVYAVSRTAPVGVDVEYEREIAEALAMSEGTFAASEVAALASAARDGELSQAFLRCWTRKEAVVKALGEGLGYPLDRFEVTVGATARLISIDGDPEAARSWSLSSFHPKAGYVAAVATPISPVELVTVVEPAEAFGEPGPPLTG